MWCFITTRHYTSLSQIPKLSLCCWFIPVNTDRDLSKLQDMPQSEQRGLPQHLSELVRVCSSNVYVYYRPTNAGFLRQIPKFGFESLKKVIYILVNINFSSTLVRQSTHKLSQQLLKRLLWNEVHTCMVLRVSECFYLAQPVGQTFYFYFFFTFYKNLYTGLKARKVPLPEIHSGQRADCICICGH